MHERSSGVGFGKHIVLYRSHDLVSTRWVFVMFVLKKRGQGHDLEILKIVTSTTDHY